MRSVPSCRFVRSLFDRAFAERDAGRSNALLEQAVTASTLRAKLRGTKLGRRLRRKHELGRAGAF